MKKRDFFTPFFLVLVAVDFIWLRSSWGKLSGGKFVPAMGATINKLASNNPYAWIKIIKV